MTSTHTPRYTLVAIALHWLLAVALIALFAVGLYMADLPFSPQRMKLFNWHKWAGVTVLALSLARLVWRATHPAPPLPESIVRTMPRWQERAHQGTQVALYALFFLVPLIGWAYSSAAGFPVVWLGVLPLPDFVPAGKALADFIKPWHALFAYTMAALALMHIGAALKHHWWQRDGLMERMLPRRI